MNHGLGTRGLRPRSPDALRSLIRIVSPFLLGPARHLSLGGPMLPVAMNGRDGLSDVRKVLENVWTLLPKRHLSATKLARGGNAWRYRQKLLLGGYGSFSFWAPVFARNCPDTIMAYRRGRETLVSFSDIRDAEPLVTCEEPTDLNRSDARLWPGLLLTPDGCRNVDESSIEDECFRRSLRKVILSDYGRFGFWWARAPSQKTDLSSQHNRYHLVDLPDGIAAVRLGGQFCTLMYAIAVGRGHALGDWVGRLLAREADGTWPSAAEYLAKLNHRIQLALTSYERHGLRDLNDFLSASDSTPSFPPDLRPGAIVLTPDCLPDCHDHTYSRRTTLIRRIPESKRRRRRRTP
jgi:hypothetical protein